MEHAVCAMQADACADVDADSCSDRHTDACADIDSYALADRHAHSCADVHVRAWLHAPYHARCGLTGTHAQACTMTHTHTTAHAHAHAQAQSWDPTHNVRHRAVHICAGTALGLRRYWSTSAPGLRPICAATGGMVGAR